MYRLHFIFVLRIIDKVIADIQVTGCAFADITIYEVRTALNHTLVNQFLERLVFAHVA